MTRRRLNLNLPKGAPHVRISRGTPGHQDDDWGGIIVAVIVVAIIVALLT